MTLRRRFRTAGVSFAPGYPSNLHRLHAICDNAAFLGEPLALVLRRNPANAYDANAIEVHVPALGDDGMVGHVPARLAQRLAPAIDNGTRVAGEVVGVAIDPDHHDRPGLEVSIWVVDTEPAR